MSSRSQVNKNKSNENHYLSDDTETDDRFIPAQEKLVYLVVTVAS